LRIWRTNLTLKQQKTGKNMRKFIFGFAFTAHEFFFTLKKSKKMTYFFTVFGTQNDRCASGAQTIFPFTAHEFLRIWRTNFFFWPILSFFQKKNICLYGAQTS
jgi:hypothetical protein